MEVLIKPNVSTRVYNFEQETSTSYIIDEEFQYHLKLEGLSSDIWNVLLTTNSYSALIEYAKKNELSDEIDDFLFELEQANLVEIKQSRNSEKRLKSNNISLKNDVNSYESFTKADCKHQSIFEEKRNCWLYQNGFLQSLVLQTGYKCNLVCCHCFNDKHQNNFELTFEQAKNAIDQAYQLGILTVGITGGECTFHKDFLKIAKYIRAKHLSLSINTNGVLLYDNSDLLNELADIYPHEILISLYSMEPDIHDEITGVKGSHFKTINTIKKLRERNIPVSINCLIIKKNLKGYQKLMKFGKEIGCRVNMSSYFIDNPKNNNSDVRLSVEQLEQLYSDKDYPGSVYNTDITFKDRDPNQTACRAGEMALSVSPAFKVTPCNDFGYILGDLNSNTLQDIWKYEVPKFSAKFFNKYLQDCGDKEYCKYCSYCPMQAFYERGFMQKSYVSCENATAYYNVLQKLKREKEL